MKKRMFLTTVLMTLVLLLAVTTATFAWYNAVEGSKQVAVTEQNITTADKTFQAGGVTVRFALSDATAKVGPSDQKGDIYYKTTNGTLVKAPKDYYVTEGIVTWTVTIEKSDGKMSDAEAAAIVAGDYVVEVSGTSLRFAHATYNEAELENAGDAVKAIDSKTVTVSFNISVVEGNVVISVSTGKILFAVNHDYTARGEELTIGAAFTTVPTGVLNQ